MGGKGFTPRFPRTREATESEPPLDVVCGFNPRFPRTREATAGSQVQQTIEQVSIHASPVRGKRQLDTFSAESRHTVSIHASPVRGKRPPAVAISGATMPFQSTLPPYEGSDDPMHINPDWDKKFQ